MHLRTIREAAAWYKDYDPSTAVTEHLIRHLVVTGKVPSMKSGRKYLITTEALDEYFKKPVEQQPAPSRSRHQYQIT